MLWALAFVVAMIAGSAQVRADPAEDCWTKTGEVAIGGCTALIQRNPRDAGAHFHRGNAYSDKKEWDRAIADFTRAIEIDPRDVAYLVRGNAYHDKKEYDRAVADYSKAIDISPRNTDAYYNRGNAFAAKQQYDEAIGDYSKSIEIDSRHGDAYNGRGWAYYNKKEYDRAIADYNKQIEISPRHEMAYNNRGNAFSAKHQYEQAIADYTKQIEISPRHEHAYSSRGLVKFYKGEFKEAAVDLSHAVELGDDAYSMLFRFLATARAGEAAGHEFEANATRLKSKEWPYAAIELLAGKRSPEATLPAAGKPDEVCEAHFYIGEWHLLRGDKSAATASLKIAVDTCPRYLVEYIAAVEELKRINP
jgi:tetratricopeptide (TPR) repeat protein